MSVHLLGNASQICKLQPYKVDLHPKFQRPVRASQPTSVLTVENVRQARRMRSLSTVGAFHVPQQIAPLGERFRAGRARVWFLPGMHSHVTHQNVLLREATRADVALERPLARVHAVVPDQVRPVNERRLADLAPERPLARVEPTVSRQVFLLLERARADVAAEAPLAPVSADVHYHVTLLGGRVRTEMAVEDLLPATVARERRHNIGRGIVNGRVSGATAARRASVRTRVHYHVAPPVGSVGAQVAEENLLSVAVSDNGWRDLDGVGDGCVTIITARVAVFLDRFLVFFCVQTGAARAVGFAETRVWPLVHVVTVLFQTDSWASRRLRLPRCNPSLHGVGDSHSFLLQPWWFLLDHNRSMRWR